MNIKDRAEKYEALRQLVKDEFWNIVTAWLKGNPKRWIMFQTYSPEEYDWSTKDNEPTIDFIGIVPGLIKSTRLTAAGCNLRYIDSSGKVHDVGVMTPEVLEDRLRSIEMSNAYDGFFEEFLKEGYVEYINKWNVTGTIKLSENGSPVIQTKAYDIEDDEIYDY